MCRFRSRNRCAHNCHVASFRQVSNGGGVVADVISWREGCLHFVEVWRRFEASFHSGVESLASRSRTPPRRRSLRNGCRCRLRFILVLILIKKEDGLQIKLCSTRSRYAGSYQRGCGWEYDRGAYLALTRGVGVSRPRLSFAVELDVCFK